MLTEPRYAHCNFIHESDQANEADSHSMAPVTRGRLYDETAEWNAWINPYYSMIDDQRFGRNVDGDNAKLDLGMDKRFGEDWIAGLCQLAG
jgi:hypothetical protein